MGDGHDGLFPVSGGCGSSHTATPSPAVRGENPAFPEQVPDPVMIGSEEGPRYHANYHRLRETAGCINRQILRSRFHFHSRPHQEPAIRRAPGVRHFPVRLARRSPV